MEASLRLDLHRNDGISALDVPGDEVTITHRPTRLTYRGKTYGVNGVHMVKPGYHIIGIFGPLDD